MCTETAIEILVGEWKPKCSKLMSKKCCCLKNKTKRLIWGFRRWAFAIKEVDLLKFNLTTALRLGHSQWFLLETISECDSCCPMFIAIYLYGSFEGTRMCTIGCSSLSTEDLGERSRGKHEVQNDWTNGYFQSPPFPFSSPFPNYKSCF